MKLALGCDHRGFPIKSAVMGALKNMGHDVADCGTHSPEPADFPDIARAVCGSILRGEAQRGIMLCGSGVGAAIACNKVPGIRAACIHDIYTAHQCVEHDDVNVACLGADVVGTVAAMELIALFLQASFSDDPDIQRRVRKLREMDEGKKR